MKSHSINKFSELYSKYPGVLDIQKDVFLTDDIIVFVDKMLYDNSIPKSFEGSNVSIYDVRQIMISANRFLLRVKQSEQYLSLKNNTAMSYFSKAVSLCKSLL